MASREQIQKIQGLGGLLAGRIRAMRMSQTALAQRAGISRQTLHRVLHSDEVSARVAKRIAAVVGSDLVALAEVGRFGSSISAAQQRPNPSDRSRVSDAARTSRGLAPLGEVLEILREDIGMSQQQMAASAGISLTTYQRIIRGDATAKDKWLLAWGEVVELRDPKDMLSIKSFAGSTSKFHRSIGRQIRAWRISSGLDLLDVADALGLDAVRVAMYEAGDDEGFLMLDDIAPLFGASSDAIYRAAVLASADEEDAKWRPPVERILTFEAAQRSARERQNERDRERATGAWDFEAASELQFIRARAGYDIEQVARLLKKPKKLIEQWEDGDREPRSADFEQMAVLYRTTPWRLRYGDFWRRAIAFPNAPESRSLIFAAIMPSETRAWLLRFLAELAELGFDDAALEGVKMSLTDPSAYYDVQFAESDSESVAFIKAKLRESAEETWKNFNQPDWVESGNSIHIPPLPRMFNDDGVDVPTAERVVFELGRRRAEAFARNLFSASPSPERQDQDQSRLRFDPFAFYRPLLSQPHTPEATVDDSHEGTP